MSKNIILPTGNTKEITDSFFVCQQKYIAWWLYFLTVLVCAMVFIGGLTRLTGSGLSMVEWRPLTGWLPPLSEYDWFFEFEDYKMSPEYKKTNLGMSLTEFKSIFWLEYLHRLWGRIIGVAFVIPCSVFVLKGWVSFALGIRLAGILLLGILQGGVGWYMVQSGLVDRPEVSQYRLMAHLGLALIIIAALFWLARGLTPSFIEKWKVVNALHTRKLRLNAAFILIVIFITACSGGLVAGLDAGLTYNTFPLMDGDWFPEGLFSMTPLYLNFFENIITVQFDHRIFAMITATLVVLFWLSSLRYEIHYVTSIAIKCLLFAVIFQVGLGIFALLMVVPLSLAIAHQTVGVFLLICGVWVLRELTSPPQLA